MKNNEKLDLFIWNNPCSEFWKSRSELMKEKISENFDQLASLTKFSNDFAQSLKACLEFEIKNKHYFLDLDFWCKEYFRYFEDVSFDLIHPFEKINEIIKLNSKNKKFISHLKKKLKKADSVITGFIICQ